MTDKKDPPIIVAEVSKNWPNDDKTPISKRFEEVINVNLKRGYRLRDWHMNQLITTHEGFLTETIIAVFERIRE